MLDYIEYKYKLFVRVRTKKSLKARILGKFGLSKNSQEFQLFLLTDQLVCAEQFSLLLTRKTLIFPHYVQSKQALKKICI